MSQTTITLEAVDESYSESFDRLVDLIRAELDLHDPFVGQKLEEYVREAEEERRWSTGDPSCIRLTHPESLAAAVRSVASDITASAAAMKTKFLDQKSDADRAALGAVLRLHESTTEPAEFDMFVVALRKQPDPAEAQALYKQILALSSGATELSNDQLALIARCIEYPERFDAIKRHRGARKYFSDLSSFLLNAGNEGRAFVRQISSNKSAAARVLRKKNNFPEPILFLSKLSVELNPLVDENSDGSKKRQIGFVQNG